MTWRWAWWHDTFHVAVFTRWRFVVECARKGFIDGRCLEHSKLDVVSWSNSSLCRSWRRWWTPTIAIRAPHLPACQGFTHRWKPCENFVSDHSRDRDFELCKEYLSVPASFEHRWPLFSRLVPSLRTTHQTTIQWCDTSRRGFKMLESRLTIMVTKLGGAVPSVTRLPHTQHDEQVFPTCYQPCGPSYILNVEGGFKCWDSVPVRESPGTCRWVVAQDASPGWCHNRGISHCTWSWHHRDSKKISYSLSRLGSTAWRVWTNHLRRKWSWDLDRLKGGCTSSSSITIAPWLRNTVVINLSHAWSGTYTSPCTCLNVAFRST